MLNSRNLNHYNITTLPHQKANLFDKKCQIESEPTLHNYSNCKFILYIFQACGSSRTVIKGHYA